MTLDNASFELHVKHQTVVLGLVGPTVVGVHNIQKFRSSLLVQKPEQAGS
jgi:hypothetical protein